MWSHDGPSVGVGSRFVKRRTRLVEMGESGVPSATLQSSQGRSMATTSSARGGIPLSLPRRWIGDLLYFAQRVPSVPVQRRMNVSELVATRQELSPRPSWVTIFAKAYALTAEEFPELRRAYLAWPWPRLYQHPVSHASIALERDYHGEPAVFFGHLRDLAQIPLFDADRKLRKLQSAPFSEVKNFRWLIRTSRLWRPLRRFVWSFCLNAFGYVRERRFGTFGVSTYSALGAESLHPISPLTSLLTYGPISSRGRVAVRLIYDHRVLDGATVARALARMEEILVGPILEELHGHPHASTQANAEDRAESLVQ